MIRIAGISLAMAVKVLFAHSSGQQKVEYPEQQGESEKDHVTPDTTRDGIKGE